MNYMTSVGCNALSTGSAWAEYKKSKTVHGIPMPEGLVESQKLEKPLFTPSTKAEQGQHDENIHPDKGESLSLVVNLGTDNGSSNGR